jgi:hypothetical protein
VSDFSPSSSLLQRDFAADDELLVYAWEGRGIGEGSLAGSLSSLDEDSHVDDADWEEAFRALGENFGRIWDGEEEEEEKEASSDGSGGGSESWI